MARYRVRSLFFIMLVHVSAAALTDRRLSLAVGRYLSFPWVPYIWYVALVEIFPLDRRTTHMSESVENQSTTPKTVTSRKRLPRYL